MRSFSCDASRSSVIDSSALSAVTSSVPPGVSYTPRDLMPTRRFSTRSTRPTPLRPPISLSAIDQRGRRHRLAVDRDRHAGLERDGHLLRRVGRGHRIDGQLEHRRFRLERRIFQRAAFVREMPEVAVARVRILLRHRHGDAARGGVVDGVFARDDVPLAPRRDDVQLRRERLIGQLEAHLVVALAGAAVRQRVAAGRQGDLDLLARDERAGGGRAEEIILLVNRSGF